MAEKKITENQEKQEEKVQVGFSAEQLAQLKAMLKAEIVEEMKADEAKRVAELDAKAKEEEAQAELVMAEAEKKMKTRLLAEEKESIFIPEDGSEGPQTISVNGVIFSVKKGESVKVPKSVAEVWNYSYEQTRKANARMKVTEIPSLTVSE